MYFDDLEILRTIDRCERDGQSAALSSGEWLSKEVLGTPHPVYEDDTCRSFIRELESAQRRDLLDFAVMGWGGIEPSINQRWRKQLPRSDATSGSRPSGGIELAAAYSSRSIRILMKTTANRSRG